MKAPRDKQTGDLLASPGARRQAAYAARQRAMWLTDDEAAAVAALIEQLRAGQDDD